MDQAAFPLFVRRFWPDVCHVPLNVVPAADAEALRGDGTRHEQPVVRGPGAQAPPLSPVPVPARPGARRPGDCRLQRHPAGHRGPFRNPAREDQPDLQRAGPQVPRGRLEARRRGPAAAPGALPDSPSLPAVRRHHPPAEEHPAPGGSLRRAARRPGGRSRLQGPAPHHHRRRDQPPSSRAPHGHPDQDAALRALPRLRALRNPADVLLRGGGLRLPVALRGLRAAPAGGHGIGDPGGHLQHQLVAGGGRDDAP